MSNNKVVLTPLIGLMNGRSKEEIERFTITEMVKHHRLRKEARDLEQTIAGTDDCPQDLDDAYVAALIATHAQHTVVSTLIDILGYIPELPAESLH